MTDKKGRTPRITDEVAHSHEGCVLRERIKRGEFPKYSYPQNGLPKVRVKSAPAISPVAAMLRAKS